MWKKEKKRENEREEKEARKKRMREVKPRCVQRIDRGRSLYFPWLLLNVIVLLGWPVVSAKVQERRGRPDRRDQDRERTVSAGFRRGAHRQRSAALAKF